MQLLPIEQAIRQRHSVRHYIRKPLTDEMLSLLREEIDRCNSEGQLHIQLVTDEPRCFSGIINYGTFSGVLFDQWDFKLITFRPGRKKIAATFAGPSCDSLDIMFRGRMTVPLQMGDLLLVPACGAYTSASATTFNGFSKAKFVVWEDIKARIKSEIQADMAKAFAAKQVG